MRHGEFDPFDESPRGEYVSAGKRKLLAADFARRLTEAGETLHPAVAHGKKIASSFWGYAWCRAVETWQDYESRLPAGRSILKNGGVIGLDIAPRRADAVVALDRVYRVTIRFAAIDPEELDAVRRRCTGKLDSLIDLIQGRLSDDIASVLSDPENGLFPRCGELKTSCDCLDDAVLCRHAAAALYAIGARLDDDPALFFTLRGIDASTFFTAHGALVSAGDELRSGLSADELSEAFGIDIELENSEDNEHGHH